RSIPPTVASIKNRGTRSSPGFSGIITVISTMVKVVVNPRSILHSNLCGPLAPLRTLRFHAVRVRSGGRRSRPLAIRGSDRQATRLARADAPLCNETDGKFLLIWSFRKQHVGLFPHR